MIQNDPQSLRWRVLSGVGLSARVVEMKQAAACPLATALKSLALRVGQGWSSKLGLAIHLVLCRLFDSMRLRRGLLSVHQFFAGGVYP